MFTLEAVANVHREYEHGNVSSFTFGMRNGKRYTWRASTSKWYDAEGRCYADSTGVRLSRLARQWYAAQD